MRCERAKIFAPFSPLRGMGEAYRAKERTVVPKACLLPDREEEIDLKLRQIRVGSLVEITYYKNGEYLKEKGRIRIFDPSKKLFAIGLPVKFPDLFDIEIL